MVKRAVDGEVKWKADPAETVLEAADVQPSKKRFRVEGGGEYFGEGFFVYVVCFAFSFQ